MVSIGSTTALDASAAEKVREKLGLPVGRPIFIYGGNMGRPQGIPFLVECLRAVAFREDCHFVVVGDGAEYPKLEAFMNEVKPTAVSLFKRLPKFDALEMSPESCRPKRKTFLELIKV